VESSDGVSAPGKRVQELGAAVEELGVGAVAFCPTQRLCASALHLRREKLPIGGLILVPYYPDEQFDSAEKLQVLASLAAANAIDEGSGRRALGVPVFILVVHCLADTAPTKGIPLRLEAARHSPPETWAAASARALTT
jgi:hypothetical protein